MKGVRGRLFGANFRQPANKNLKRPKEREKTSGRKSSSIKRRERTYGKKRGQAESKACPVGAGGVKVAEEWKQLQAVHKQWVKVKLLMEIIELKNH